MYTDFQFNVAEINPSRITRDAARIYLRDVKLEIRVHDRTSSAALATVGYQLLEIFENVQAAPRHSHQLASSPAIGAISKAGARSLLVARGHSEQISVSKILWMAGEPFA